MAADSLSDNPLPDEATQVLQDIVMRISSESSGNWMGLDVTMPQMKVLMLLRENGAMRVGVLARHLNVSTPTITGIVDRLVRQTLVRRDDDPTDRRVVLNVLTRQGEEMMDRLRQRGNAELARLVGTLTPKERHDLTRLLTRLRESFDHSPGNGIGPVRSSARNRHTESSAGGDTTSDNGDTVHTGANSGSVETATVPVAQSQDEVEHAGA